MLYKLVEIIKKDLRLLMRSKFSSLVILLAPLLIILITTVSLENQNNFYITVAAYSKSYSSLAKAYLSKLEMNSIIVKYVDSKEDCINAVKLGKTHACIVFSPNLNEEQSYNSYVNFYVDYAHLNLAWFIKDLLFTKVSEENKKISKDLINDLLSVVEVTKNNIDSEKQDITKIATSNDKLSGIFSTLHSYLSATRPNYDFSKLKINDINITASRLKQKSLATLVLTDNKLMDLSTNLNSLKNEISKVNDSALRTQLLNEVNSLINTINSYHTTLQINKDSLQSTASSLQMYLENLKSSVSELSELLNKIKLSYEKSKEHINDGKKESSEMLHYIFNLQRSINEIESSLKGVNILPAEKIAEPFPVEIYSITPNKQKSEFIIPMILSLTVLFVSLILSSTLLQMEKNSEAHIRVLITPNKTILLSWGTLLTTLFITLLQYIISSAFIMLINSFPNPIFVFSKGLLVTSLASSVFVLLGILIGSLSKNEQTSLILTISLTLGFILFSGMIYPLEAFPRNTQIILKVNPLYLLHYLYDQIFIKNSPIREISFQIIILLLWIIALIMTLIFLQDLFDEKFLKVHRSKVLHKKKTRKRKVNNEEYVKLTKLLLQLNRILSPKNKISEDEVEHAKKLYLDALAIYQRLNKKDKQEFFEELNLIHNKLSSL